MEQKRKEITASSLGLTVEEYDLQREASKKEKLKAKLKGGLTDEGRKRISDSLKKRWEDPEFRMNYTLYAFGNRNHSEETREKISQVILNLSCG